MIKKEAPNFSFIIDPDNNAGKPEPRLDAKRLLFRLLTYK